MTAASSGRRLVDPTRSAAAVSDAELAQLNARPTPADPDEDYLPPPEEPADSVTDSEDPAEDPAERTAEAPPPAKSEVEELKDVVNLLMEQNRQLMAALAQPAPSAAPPYAVVGDDPGGYAVSSADSRQERRQRVLDAQITGLDPWDDLPRPDRQAGEVLKLHFLEDGFSVLGQVWYRGQYLEVTVGSPAYLSTVDRNGRTWLDLLEDDGAQMERFGKVMFRPGPWRGRPFEDSRAQQAERSRGGRPPTSLAGVGPGARTG